MNKGPIIFWIMGPTSAGKSTIGQLFAESLKDDDVPAIHLDGNVMRNLFGSKLGFSPQDRLLATSTLVQLANMIADAGLITIVSALSAHEDARQLVREKVNNLVLVYLKCPMEICFERDSLGLYRKAREGIIDPKTMIGLNSPYVAPTNPDITLETDKLSPEESVEHLKDWLRNAGYGLPLTKGAGR